MPTDTQIGSGPAGGEAWAPMAYPERKEAMLLLTTTFRFERYAYLILSLVTASVFVGLIVFWLARRGQADFSTLFSLMAPTGVMGFLQGMMLRLWTQSRDILLGVAPEARR